MMPFDALESIESTPISALTSFAATRCPGEYALTWSMNRMEPTSSRVAITSRPRSLLAGVRTRIPRLYRRRR